MKTIYLAEPGKGPRQVMAANLLGTAIRVYLKGRTVDYEAFHFMPTAITFLDGEHFMDGYDDERINLRVSLKDIDYVIKGANK